MKVTELVPGDVVRIAGIEGILIAKRSPHPLYPALDLVIWVVEDEVHFDALSPLQDVGDHLRNDQPRLRETIGARYVRSTK